MRGGGAIVQHLEYTASADHIGKKCVLEEALGSDEMAPYLYNRGHKKYVAIKWHIYVLILSRLISCFETAPK